MKGRIGYKHTEEAKAKISEASKRPRIRKPKDFYFEFTKRYIPVTESGCWIWIGNTMNNGYGVISLGARGKSELAHRFSYRYHYGSIADGMDVCHTCDVQPCVNPDHLFEGTVSDNMKDCWSKGRGYLVGGAFGEAHPCATITSEQVVEMRKLYHDGRLVKIDGKFSARELAKMFHVTYATVKQAIAGITWKKL